MRIIRLNNGGAKAKYFMKIQEILDLAIKMGINADLRGSMQVEKHLQKIKNDYEKLNDEQKKDFDLEKLTNPYLDTRIHISTDKEIKKVLTGVDIGGEEVFLADKLGVDLIIGHHPTGKALTDLSDVMNLQAEVLANYGVPINIASGLLRERISEVWRGVNPANHYRSIDTCKHFNVGMMNVHTPADNLVATFLKQKIESQKFEYVFEILKMLKEIPEYKEAEKMGFGPRLFAGSPDNYCGKIAITEITGGTEGTPKIYEKMAQAGIGTIIGMHMSEEHKKQAEAAHINAIIAGHISSDSIGMNLFLDELEKKGIEIVPVSGIIRVKRF